MQDKFRRRLSHHLLSAVTNRDFLPRTSATILTIVLSGTSIGLLPVSTPYVGAAYAADSKTPDPKAVLVVQFNAATKEFTQYGEPKKPTRLRASEETRPNAVSTGRPIRIRIVNPNSFAESYKIEAFSVDFHRVDVSKFAARFPGIGDFLPPRTVGNIKSFIADGDLPLLRAAGYSQIADAFEKFNTAQNNLEAVLPKPADFTKWRSIKPRLDRRLATASTTRNVDDPSTLTANAIISNATIRAAVGVEVNKLTTKNVSIALENQPPFADLSDDTVARFRFLADDISKPANEKLDEIQKALDAYNSAKAAVTAEYNAIKDDLDIAEKSAADKLTEATTEKKAADAKQIAAQTANTAMPTTQTNATLQTAKEDARKADEAKQNAAADKQKATNVKQAAKRVSEQATGDTSGTRATTATALVKETIEKNIVPAIELVKTVMNKRAAPTYLEKEIRAQSDRIDIKITVEGKDADAAAVAAGSSGTTLDPGTGAPRNTPSTAATTNPAQGAAPANGMPVALIDDPGIFKKSDYPYSLPVSKRWVLDTSGGLVVTFTGREKFGTRPEVIASGQLSQNVVHRAGRNTAEGDLGIFLHYYRTNPNGWAFGPTLGIVPVGTSNIKSYLPGFSFIRGQENRLILTVGAAIGDVEKLNGFSVGDVLPAGQDLTRRVQQVRPFVSLTFQITRF